MACTDTSNKIQLYQSMYLIFKYMILSIKMVINVGVSYTEVKL